METTDNLILSSIALMFNEIQLKIKVRYFQLTRLAKNTKKDNDGKVRMCTNWFNILEDKMQSIQIFSVYFFT